jgi:hypothetical protein
MTLSDTPNSFKHQQSIVRPRRGLGPYPSVILAAANSEQITNRATGSPNDLCATTESHDTISPTLRGTLVYKEKQSSS